MILTQSESSSPYASNSPVIIIIGAAVEGAAVDDGAVGATADDAVDDAVDDA